MADVTTRLSLPFPELGDNNNVPADMENLATALDNAAVYEQGGIGSLPVATSVPNGTWYADTASGGHIYVNVGTGAGRQFRRVPVLDSSNNLSLPSDLTVVDDISCDDISVGDDAVIGGDVQINGTLSVGGAPIAGATNRGKSIIATAESRANTAYGTLTTPDQVSGIVLPTDGLLVVGYQAQMKSSVAAAGRAALFIGANQYKMRVADVSAGPAAPVTMAAPSINSADTYAALGSAGQLGIATENNGPTSSDVTTGQGVGVMGGADQRLAIEVNGSTSLSSGVASYVSDGGLTVIFAAAGTYDVSVQFKASSGSVTAKERKLWVWVLGF